MHNDSTTTGTGPWRVLILDPDPADPKLILATVTDVRSARITSEPRPIGDATMWVRNRLGSPAILEPMPGAIAWRVDADGPRQ